MDEILAEASGKQATEATKVLYRNPGQPPAVDDRRVSRRTIKKASRCSTSRSPPPARTRRWNPGSPPASAHVGPRQPPWTFEEPVIGHFAAGQPAGFLKPTTAR